jgi:hypothetical protein
MGPRRRARSELADDAALDSEDDVPMDSESSGGLASRFEDVSINDAMPKQDRSGNTLSLQKRTGGGVCKKKPSRQRKTPRTTRPAKQAKKRATADGNREVHELLVGIPAETVDAYMSKSNLRGRGNSALYEFLGYYGFFMRFVDDQEGGERSMAKDVDYVSKLLPRVVSIVGIDELLRGIEAAHQRNAGVHKDLQAMEIQLKHFQTRVLVRWERVHPRLYELFDQYICK